jgi:hypothetical protein
MVAVCGLDDRSLISTRWFKYDRDDLCVNKSQFFPVIFEPPCIMAGCGLDDFSLIRIRPELLEF